jgi:NitT/TauT family transport system permease protein
MPDRVVTAGPGGKDRGVLPARPGPLSRSATPWYRRAAIWYPATAAAVFLAAWWGFSRSIDPLLFSSPQGTFGALLELATTGELAGAVSTTLRTFVVGAGLGVLAGMLLGLASSLMPTVKMLLTPLFVAIWATPIIAMVPLVIILFGIDEFGRVALVFVATVVPVYMNAEVGFEEARPDLVEVAKSFSATRRDLVRHVTIPGATPYLIAGLRIGLGRALGAVIVAEMFLDLTGMGGIVQTSSVFLRLDRMLAAAFVIACLGTLLILLLDLVERKVAPWRGEKER